MSGPSLQENNVVEKPNGGKPLFSWGEKTIFQEHVLSFSYTTAFQPCICMNGKIYKWDERQRTEAKRKKKKTHRRAAMDENKRAILNTVWL